MTQNEEYDNENAVAIIGIGIRVPGATDVNAFWRNMIAGRESIQRYDRQSLLDAGVPPAVADNLEYVSASGHLDDADCFDAGFFGLARSEAEMLDPQHRLFLESAWHALEDAGCDPFSTSAAIGLFGGCFMNKYLPLNLYANRRFMSSPLSTFARNYNDKDFLCGRVAHLLDLKGPVVTVQTACSTSLVAVHLACQALLTYECDMALAGGASLNLPYPGGYLAPEGTMFSRDGQCRSFDARANGTLPGSGAVLVALRRLTDAVAAGDNIRGVILGSAVNNDGARKASFTAPNVSAQRDVILSAQSVAGVQPSRIGYLEAHGTGTRLGDPIEVAALTEAFRRGTDRVGYSALGAVKANIGHLDAAAGTAGLVRAVLCLEREMIPPVANFQSPNPDLNLDTSPFFVPATPQPWPKGEAIRIAGVSSFGVGGTNAHVVLAEAPKALHRSNLCAKPSQLHLLPVSGKTPQAVIRNARRLADWLEAPEAPSLADGAYSLTCRRRAFDCRSSVVAKTKGEAASALRQLAKQDVVRVDEAPEIIFMFPGVGTQYPDMALGIYRQEPNFAEDIDEIARLLMPKLGYDLRQYLFPSAFPGEQIDREAVINVVTAIFAVSYAIARLWLQRGLKPAALIGHSLGEYVAATIAGVLSLEDGLDLTVRRGRLFENIPEGRMMVTPLPAEEIIAILPAEISLAAVNAPMLSLVSGNEGDLRVFAERLLDERGLTCRILPIRMASHSHLIDPYLDEFRRIVSGYRLNTPKIPYLSCLTGTWIQGNQATDPTYWADQLRNPVRFAKMLDTVGLEGSRIFLEVGPGSTLTSLLRAQGKYNATSVHSLRHPADPDSDQACFLAAMGKLWRHGATPDLMAEIAEEAKYVPMPPYAFERDRHWIAPDRLIGPGAPFDISDEALIRRQPQATSSLEIVDDAEDTDDDWTPTQKTVAMVWREILGLPSVSRHDDFNACGGHSLLAAQVLSRLKQDINVRLDITDIYAAPTIEKLADRIDRRKTGKLEDKVDLRAEVRLDPAIQPVSSQKIAPPDAPVFLTGATGFLGIYLLDELLRQTSGPIYLLVRADNEDTGRARVASSFADHNLPVPDLSRCRFFCGDLEAMKFGLTEYDWAELSHKVGRILHCGAFVNFARPYSVLKAANVGSVETIFRLAVAGPLKQVHFISTVFVNMGAIVSGAQIVAEDALLSDPVGHDTGYTESKWVAEGLCNLARARGIPVSIYRPGNILSAMRTGVANAKDYLCRVLAGSVELGAVPLRQYNLPAGAVDDVAALVVNIMGHPENLGRTFHVIQPKPVPWNTLMGSLIDNGYQLETLQWAPWCAKLRAYIATEPLDVLQPLVGMLNAPPDRYMPVFDVKNLQTAMERAGQHHSDLNKAYFARMIGWMRIQGHLPKLEYKRREIESRFKTSD